MLRQNPNLGEKSVDGLLRAQGHIVQRQRIRDTIWAVGVLRCTWPSPCAISARSRGSARLRIFRVSEGAEKGRGEKYVWLARLIC